MRFLYILSAFYIFFVTPSLALAEIEISEIMSRKIDAYSIQKYQQLPVEAVSESRQKQIFKELISGFKDLSQAQKRYSKTLGYTSYTFADDQKNIYLFTENDKQKRNAQRAVISYKPWRNLKALSPLDEKSWYLYREGPTRQSYRHLRPDIKADFPMEKEELIKLAQDFVIGFGFIRETADDKIASIQVLERRISEDAGEGRQGDDYVVQQDVMFTRSFKGQPVVNSKVVVSIFPDTREIVAFKHICWKPIDDTVSKQIRSSHSFSKEELGLKITKRIKDISFKLPHVQLNKLTQGWFQTEKSLDPILISKFIYRLPKETHQRSQTNIVQIID